MRCKPRKHHRSDWFEDVIGGAFKLTLTIAVLMIMVGILALLWHGGHEMWKAIQ